MSAHLLGLIPDRALRPGDRDLFAHDDFVDELEAIIAESIVSANIALYGSWGAGKSGIAKRLRHRLENGRHKDDIEYVELNAAKYARAPLLRHFILEIARQTGGKSRAAEYRQKLYAHITHQKLNAPRQWVRALRVAFWAFLAVLVIDLVLLATLSGGALHVVNEVSRYLLPTAIALAAVTKLWIHLLPLATASLHVEAPASEEQFEEIFHELLGELKITGEDKRRLVVLIDELDRCSPQQVADTLESLRTFLDIPGCIFIVAADQQALEHALTLRVRQATPPDPTNPYYSAGSAYLDKIFEYQISLPPLQASRLVDFALELVKEAGGPWNDLPNVERVLSVLIPVHVQSPRRVKVLLNRFVLAHAVAAKRAAAGKLDAQIAVRADELAKLVCLRTEFPLFVADLEADWRLPDLVLRSRDLITGVANEADPVLDAIDDALRDRARLYALGKLPVAELLSDESTTFDISASEFEDEEEPDKRAEGPAEITRESSRVTAVHRALGLQLVEYLQKTRRIQDPRPDLIHLEGAGAVVGIEPALAQRIQLLALNNQADQVAGAISRMDREGSTRALTMLAGQLRAAKGNDADNIAHSLLRSLARAGDEIGKAVPSLPLDILEYARRGDIETRDLPGTLRLGVVGENPELVDLVMGREELGSDFELQDVALRFADRLPEHQVSLGHIVANRSLDGGGAELAELLTEVSESTAASVLTEARGDTIAGLAGLNAAADEAATVAPVPGAGPAPPTASSPPTDAADQLNTALSSYSVFVRGLLERGESRRLAEFAFVSLVEAAQTREPIWRLQLELQKVLGTATTHELSDVLLRDVSGWQIKSWPGRLGFVDASLVTPDVGRETLSALAVKLWRTSGDTTAEQEKASLEALAELIRVGLKHSTAEVTEAAVADIAGSDTVEEFSERARAIARAGRFAKAGLIDPVAFDAAALGFVADVARAQLIDDDEIKRLASELVDTALAHAPTARSDVTTAAVEATQESEWLTSPWREALLLALGIGNRATTPVLAENLAQVTAEHGMSASDAVEIWLEHYGPSPDDASRVLKPLIAVSSPPTLTAAISEFSGQLTGDGIANLVVPWLQEALRVRPRREFLEAARFNEADEDQVATVLVDLANQADNADEREILIQLWEELAPRDEAARRLLVRGVAIPFSAKGIGAYDLVRRHLKLAVPPPYGTKAELVRALERNAPDAQRASAMHDRMRELGLIERKQRRFGPFRF